MILIKDYDFRAGCARLAARVSRERNLVFDRHGDIDLDYTKWIRQLGDWGTSLTAAFRVDSAVRSSLGHLLDEDGGTVLPVANDYAAHTKLLTIDKPLVRALLVLRNHPCVHKFFEGPFLRGGNLMRGDAWKATDANPLPILNALFERYPEEWDIDRFVDLVAEGMVAAFGDSDVDPAWTPAEMYPGSRIYKYAGLMSYAVIYNAAGAFDPAFGRRDALSGEWWLVQPVSPRLEHRPLMDRFRLEYMGYVPQAHVDVPGRVLVACIPDLEMPDARRIALLEDSKWIAGWQKVTWRRGEPPLDDIHFELDHTLEGVTEESYGPFKHASELPPWPPPT